jgi:hypothetical protein
MQQIMGTIKVIKGEIKIESKEEELTEFILTFPKSEKVSMQNWSLFKFLFR